MAEETFKKGAKFCVLKCPVFADVVTHNFRQANVL